jgi:hypothetical protein
MHYQAILHFIYVFVNISGRCGYFVNSPKNYLGGAFQMNRARKPTP